MRKRHWLAGLLSGWLTVIGGQALAQTPPIAQGNMGNPDTPGIVPAPYSSSYGANSSLPPPQGPMNYQRAAWPEVSPYGGPLVDQTANENGLWFRNIITGNRKYYFRAEALLGHTNMPNTTVGAPNVNIPNIPQNIYNIQSIQNSNSIFANNTSQFQQTTAGTNSVSGLPDRSLANNTGGGGGGNNGTTSGGGVPIFSPKATGDIPDNLVTGGGRLSWGWWNPDESGVEVSAFMINRVYSTLAIEDPNGFAPISANEIILNELHAYAGIPLGGADTDHNGLPGVVQPFDMYYIMKMQTQLGGAHVDWFSAPIFERPAFKIRPAYGARYLTVREKFDFMGADSGLGYTIDSYAADAGGGGNQNGNGGNGGNAAKGGTGTGGSGNTTGDLTPLTVDPGTFYNPMYSALTSVVNTQLAGPEMGLRFDFGKENFNIHMTSKLGLLVNYTSQHLNGYNIGDAYYPTATSTLANPQTAMPRNNAAATAFDSKASTTTMSPMFEQSIFARANLFQYVPILNRSVIFNTAQIQLGYTAMFIGGMSRPTSDIDWQAYPVNPQLTSKRNTFFNSNYSVGIEWNY